MKCAVVVFPGSNCDSDCYHVLEAVMRQDVQYAWHKDGSLPDCDLVLVPGGFSYGDYLRAGSIARFSPIMTDVIKHANEGRPVVGICNGFQILLEAGLLPGAMLRNDCLSFVCEHALLNVENTETMFTKNIKPDALLNIPIAHGEGNYYCDDETYVQLEANKQIIFRYVNKQGAVTAEANPNGSRGNIAGIINRDGNVLGMMPHPERASEKALGSVDGKGIWESLIAWSE